MFDAYPRTIEVAASPDAGWKPAFWRGPASPAIKRFIDVVGATALLVFFFWLLLVVALLVRTTSPGPALFRQRRTGMNGKVFSILKFRTMRVMEDGPDIAHAAPGDLRVTRVGAYLRRTSIDELPQLLNVLKGDMSLVGPRPHAVAHDQHYGRLVPAYHRRFLVRPGMTGAAQILGLRGHVRGPECMARRVAADIAYAEGWTVMDDLWIVLRTFALLIRQTNAG